jgi:hypothetical protein
VVKIGVQKSDSLNPTVYDPLYNPTKEEGSSLSVPKAMLIDGSNECVYIERFMHCYSITMQLKLLILAWRYIYNLNTFLFQKM